MRKQRARSLLVFVVLILFAISSCAQRAVDVRDSSPAVRVLEEPPSGVVRRHYGATENFPPVVVDYSRSLDDMIRGGKYRTVDRKINKRHFSFTDSGRVSVDLVLVSFDRQWMWPNEVRDELRRMGLRPATLPELLAFGERYSGTEYGSIIALESVWLDRDNNPNYPCIIGGDHLQTLDLFVWRIDIGDYRFPPHAHFLAVRPDV